LSGLDVPGEAVEERVSGPYDFENEFQFQLQGYASAAETVNPGPHNLV
jgi:hypothetical protein